MDIVEAQCLAEPTHAFLIEIALTFRVLHQPEGEGGDFFTVQVPALSLFKAGNHLHLVHLEHLFPAVGFVRHVRHVAPVWMDQLAQILRVNRDFELVALGEKSMRFDNVTGVHALCVTIAQPIE